MVVICGEGGCVLNCYIIGKDVDCLFDCYLIGKYVGSNCWGGDCVLKWYLTGKDLGSNRWDGDGGIGLMTYIWLVKMGIVIPEVVRLHVVVKDGGNNPLGED